MAQTNYLVSHRRQIFWSAASAVSGYIFLIAGILTFIIEFALQVDQEFLRWNALFTAALGLVVGGMFFLLASKWIFPFPKREYIAARPGPTLEDLLIIVRDYLRARRRYRQSEAIQ